MSPRHGDHAGHAAHAAHAWSLGQTVFWCVTAVAIGACIITAAATPVAQWALYIRYGNPLMSVVTAAGTWLSYATSEGTTTIDLAVPPEVVITCAVCAPGEVPRQTNGTCFECYTPTSGGVNSTAALNAVGSGVNTAVNGTLDVRGHIAGGTLGTAYYSLSGDDVLLTVDRPADMIATCGAPCAPGQVPRQAGNGTCFECYTPSAGGTNVTLTGVGAVAVEVRANDTRVYTVPWTWMTDPMPTTFGFLAYSFISGAYSATALPPGVPGNLENTTMYNLVLSFNAQVQLDPFIPNPDLGAVLMLNGVTAYFPQPVTNPTLDRFHTAGFASCVYYNGATPLRMSFNGLGVHNNVGTYAFYFPNLDAAYNPYLARCEFRVEMWLASP